MFDEDKEIIKNIGIKELVIDKHNKSFKLVLENGETMEGVISRRNGELESIIPNWFTPGIVADRDGVDEKRARDVLERFENEREDALADETASVFWSMWDEMKEEEIRELVGKNKKQRKMRLGR